MSERRYLMIINNFLHDMATGTWAACVLVIWLLAGRVAGMSTLPPEAVVALREAMLAVFQLALVALVVIGGTGGVRLGYWRQQTPQGDRQAKRRALIIKHVAFAVIYGLGTAWLWTLVR
jgi:hypothetical protein